MHDCLNALRQKHNLSRAEARRAFDSLFSGTVPPDQIAAFLLALKEKGETTDELYGAVTSMRAHMIPVHAPESAIDIVGTGGDHHGTLNISTAVALVVAASDVCVAKHGNRAASSLSGSSDILAELGVNLNAPLAVVEKSLAEIGIGFLFAPNHHPAMRHVADVRRQLKTRTIFNLLGPLTNPANVTYHLIGAYAPEWLAPMADVLRELGSEAAWLAHGLDGMDEITTTTGTEIVGFRGTTTKRWTLTPEDAALPRAPLEALKGGDAAHNAAALRRLLSGEKGAYRDIVLLNAAAALCVTNKAHDLTSGIEHAAAALDSGHAAKKLDQLVRITR